ncbi:MAG: ankyrin repeat domain-containing protein [Turneriella sp.]|nr:ankyrin repeat domain-containing protein [Turneriella sp.]
MKKISMFKIFCLVLICASTEVWSGGAEDDLISAVLDDDIADVQKALAKKPNLDFVNEKGNTALLGAAARGKTEIVRLIIDAGATLDLESHSYTALNSSAQSGHTEVVKLLLKAGAKIDYQTQTGSSMSGKTALMAAASRNKTETVKALLEANANTALRNSDGETAYDIAKKRGYEDLAILLKEAEKKPARSKKR